MIRIHQQKIFFSDKNKDDLKCMEKANNDGKNFTIFLLKYMVLGFVGFLLQIGALNVAVSLIKFGYINAEHMNLPYKFVLVNHFHRMHRAVM